jgi:hypothetical protein
MIGSPPMVPDLTVLDHVMLVATTWADNLRAAARVTHGVLTESGLDSLGERFPMNCPPNRPNCLVLRWFWPDRVHYRSPVGRRITARTRPWPSVTTYLSHSRPRRQRLSAL